jgi:DnaJ-class molecular chaperone
VPLEDAVLGSEITVPTLRSRVALTIPAETQNGQRFRLAGQGMPSMSQPGSKGDLYATVKVKLPTNLTDEEKELFRRLKEIRAASRS